MGGYGRREQCLYSDVDLLFLFQNRIPAEAEALIREIIYPLWDIGLDIGHATRTLKDCINLAGTDFEVLTSLLDARFICGMSLLYSDMTEQIQKKVILRQSNKITSWLVETNQQRHQHFGDATYLLEPNIKEGQGGLRDYHTMLWLSQIRFNLKHPKDLEYYGCLSHDEFEALSKSLSFIWDIRSRLHHLIGRKYDQLHFEYQPRLAESLKYKEDNGQKPVEQFLGELHGQMDFIKQEHQMFLYELGAAKKWFNIKKKFPRETQIHGLEVEKDMLTFSAPEDILKSPELLIKIFQESVRLKIPLNIEAKRLVKEFSYIINDNFRTSHSVVKIFEYILLSPAPTFNVLNEMLNTGFLVRFIPEFKGIINRIEYDEYHVFPVDKHSLRTVRTIKQFGTPDDPLKDTLYGNLYKEMPKKKPLLWAALLHDIGKGESTGENHAGKGAEIAESILTQKGLNTNDIETVSFLIREHLFLVNTATRRDINDEETAIFCAGKIQDINRLKMLYLLTVADFIATGPKAWNEWVSVLLRDLFFKVLKILEKGDLASHEAVESVKNKKEICRKALQPLVGNEGESLLDDMAPRYLLYTPAEDISAHVRLYQQLIGNADSTSLRLEPATSDFVWSISKDEDSNTREITICAKDSPGFFSKIAGVFTLNSIHILEAQIYTWNNGISLDVFRVKPPPDQLLENEKWAKAEKDLCGVLTGKTDLKKALSERTRNYASFKPRTLEEPNKVVIDNETSGFFTIIEVFTYDYPGLLFKITDVLFKCNLNIYFSQIATKADQVVDVFYVRDFDGQKTDSPEQIEFIKAAITEVLPEV